MFLAYFLQWIQMGAINNVVATNPVRRISTAKPQEVEFAPIRSPRSLCAAIVRRLVTPLVPDGKMLPYLFWLRRFRGDEDRYLANLKLFRGKGKTALDIGANIGLYTYSLSKLFECVHAFEINDENLKWIRGYDASNVVLHAHGLSSVPATVKLNIPVAHRRVLTGWGTIHPELLPPADRCIEKECEVAPLDDSAFIGVDFIKIDVEGHEVEVLKGGAETISASRPVIQIEVKLPNEATVESWFRKLG